MAPTLPQRPRASRGRPPHPDVLTPAEWRVLGWIRHGLSRRAIADQLSVSEYAVKYHLAGISSKLGVSGLRALRHWPGCRTPLTSRRSPMSTSVALGPLGQVSLLARDVARTEAFYRDTLGLPHVFTFGDLAFFDMAGTRLYLRAVPDADWRPSSILYFRVDDIEAQFRAVVAAGARPSGEPHLIHRDEEAGTEEWMAFFEDPDGNTLALMATLAIRARDLSAPHP
jgi:catechol 2,3-dioxygenase-like lactoylglutathione lyase family enzyme/DNA-binding CsgD family transcriptional regulator